MTVKRINLALQGGGAHGAFTWGVLDRLLEEPEIEIAGISGTSAGALNGAALKAGLVQGGRERAREQLDWLWSQIGAIGDMRLTHWFIDFSPVPAQISRAVQYSLPYSVIETASHLMSPYYYGPFYRHPLKKVVQQLHYEHICCEAGPRFYVCATNVRTGKGRIFTKEEISTDAILASACLPTLFQAVEIKDPQTGKLEAYWDGGYTGNPALFPLYDPALPDDIVIVNINPLVREDVPCTPQEIENRINEVSFNSSLLRDLRAIAFVKRLIAEGRLQRGELKDVLVHMIADDDLMQQLNVATKMVPTPLLLDDLKQAGRAAAGHFIDNHKSALNHEPTVDLLEMFS